jgi:tmRNA-binding protein
LDDAEAILLENGGLEVGDIREGEISITDLYIYIQQKKAQLRGVELQVRDIEVPFKLDLRMQ